MIGIVLGITDEIRIEATDHDREIGEERRGADLGIDTWDEPGMKAEMAVMIEPEMVGGLAMVGKTGGIRNVREAEIGIEHCEVLRPS